MCVGIPYRSPPIDPPAYSSTSLNKTPQVNFYKTGTGYYGDFQQKEYISYVGMTIDIQEI